jgi:hypothetical protein
MAIIIFRFDNKALKVKFCDTGLLFYATNQFTACYFTKKLVCNVKNCVLVYMGVYVREELGVYVGCVSM